MKRLCDFYIRNAEWIGAIFCAVPVIGWFTATFASVPFRSVYLLRLGLCLFPGCAIAAYVNRYGVQAWLRKHRSVEGPATVLDGALVGGAVGIGCTLLPALTAFISTHHPEEAKTFVIVGYLCATLAGAVIGGILSAIGRTYLERTSAAE